MTFDVCVEIRKSTKKLWNHKKVKRNMNDNYDIIRSDSQVYHIRLFMMWNEIKAFMYHLANTFLKVLNFINNFDYLHII